MIIDYFHIISVSIFPNEADAPLLIDSDAVLPCPIPLKCFEFIPRGNPEVLQDFGPVQVQQPSPCLVFNCLEAHYLPVVEKGFRFLASE
jgi:hypothetical protein